MPAVLTIAGSDSGGGAGIEADLKTFAAFGVFGTCAITCVTAQNPDKVAGITAVPARMVELQIKTACAAFPPAAAKTGMLYSAAIIRAVSEAIKKAGIRRLVVDPVMVAGSGARLLKQEAIAEFRRTLAPLASVLTPNIPEAEVLCGFEVKTIKDMSAAAQLISARFGCACVVKGGHLPGRKIRNLLFSGGREAVFSAPRVPLEASHGTGCTFSAALAACLALGKPLAEATRLAGLYVAEAIRSAPVVCGYRPLGWPPANTLSRCGAAAKAPPVN